MSCLKLLKNVKSKNKKMSERSRNNAPFKRLLTFILYLSRTVHFVQYYSVKY